MGLLGKVAAIKAVKGRNAPAPAAAPATPPPAEAKPEEKK